MFWTFRHWADLLGTRSKANSSLFGRLRLWG